MALPSAQTQGRNGGPGRMGGQQEKQLPTPTPGLEGPAVGDRTGGTGLGLLTTQTSWSLLPQ